MTQKRNYWIYIEGKDFMPEHAKKLVEKNAECIYYLVEKEDKTRTYTQVVLDRFNTELLEEIKEYEHEDGGYELSTINREEPIWQEIEKRLENDVIHGKKQS